MKLFNPFFTGGATSDSIITIPGAKTLTGDGSLVYVDDGTLKPYVVGDQSTGLEAINEGNGIGWRLIGRDPAYYVNIGEQAIDFSLSDDNTGVMGAAGEASVAYGYNNKVSGYGSVVYGYNNINTGHYGLVTGSDNNNSGFDSVVHGSYNNVPSGNYQTTFGVHNTNSGWYSSAIGLGLINRTIGCAVFGVGNTDRGTQLSLNDPNYPRLIVGNGTILAGPTNNVGTRKDAFVVYNKGTATLPSVTNALIDAETTGKVLITREWIEAQDFGAAGTDKYVINVSTTSTNIVTTFNDSTQISNPINYDIEQWRIVRTTYDPQNPNAGGTVFDVGNASDQMGLYAGAGIELEGITGPAGFGWVISATGTTTASVDVTTNNSLTSWQPMVWHISDSLYSSSTINVQASTGLIRTNGYVVNGKDDLSVVLAGGGTMLLSAIGGGGLVDTWRPVQVGGIALESNETLNLIAGDNITISEVGGAVTFGAVDTWRSVQVNSSAIGDTETLNLVAGANITLSELNGTVTIASTATEGTPDSWRPITAAGVTLSDTTSTLDIRTGDGVEVSSFSGGILTLSGIEHTLLTPGIINTGVQTIYGTKTFNAANTFFQAIEAAGTCTATDHINISDRRLKENITDYNPKSINVKWREYTIKETGERQIGVIADELEKVAPEFVVKGKTEEDIDSVKYTRLLIAKIAELEERIKILENECSI